MPKGEVHIRFDAPANHTYWLTTHRDGSGNLVHQGGIVWFGRDFVPHGRPTLFGLVDELDYEQSAEGILVHEILHAMGFLDHPDMASVISYDRELSDYSGLPGHYMYPLDREGVLAAYTRLKRGTRAADIATELGPWSDTSTHVRGILDLPSQGEVAFGAAHRNGFVQPWAYGPASEAGLFDNAALSGTARWEGRLLGLTPQAAVVAGDANLTVELSSLTGRIDFTELEAWAAGQAPGAVGTGTMWGDGDLRYGIQVTGSTFIQSGSGDAGTVTGMFIGSAQDGMGGTLERDDLAAGFGGVRD